MKYGIKKFYDPTPGSGGAVPTLEDFKKAFAGELVTIKGALEENFKKKDDERDKNFEDKLEVLKDAQKSFDEKLKNPDITLEAFKEMQEDLKVTLKAFDQLQTRIKNQSMVSKGGNPENSFVTELNRGIESLKGQVHGDSIKGNKHIVQLELKAVGDMTIAANLSGNIPNTYRPGMVMPPYEMVHMRDLVNVTPSETDSYHFYRFSQGEGNIEFQNQELETKAQIDEDVTEQTVNLNYLAGWLRISKKMLRNFKALQATLSRWLPEQYFQREDTKAYQALISAATGVQDTSITGGFIQMIIRTIGKQRKAKYNVNGIVVDGEVWANMLTYKGSGSGEFTMPIGIVTISPTGQLMICGIPVYVASWVGGDQALVGDWRFFEIIQSEGLSLQFFEQDGTNVRENKITVRIEASVGFAMLDPKAFVVVNLATAS